MSKQPLILRELEKGDLPKLNAWRNDKRLLDLLGNNFLFISSAVDAAWFENYISNRDKAVRLAIVVADSNEYIGNVNLTSLHPVNRSAEFSILIGEEAYWSKGLGSIATRMMLEHGFNDRGLNRIYLTLLKDNTRALKLYEKMGFKVEGVKRQDVFKNGEFQDSIMMSILKSEFKA